MSSAAVVAASQRRLDTLLSQEISARCDLLLANYQHISPSAMGHLRFLLRHYAKNPHPFRACVRDNMKRFGPGRTEAVCGTLKDAIRQTTHWRGHPAIDTPANSPGVAIAEADAPAAKLAEVTLAEAFEQEFGIAEVPEQVWKIIEQLGESCDVYRVLIGLDEAPRLELAA